jgi:hypothetical protein
MLKSTDQKLKSQTLFPMAQALFPTAPTCPPVESRHPEAKAHVKN